MRKLLLILAALAAIAIVTLEHFGFGRNAAPACSMRLRYAPSQAADDIQEGSAYRPPPIPPGCGRSRELLLWIVFVHEQSPERPPTTMSAWRSIRRPVEISTRIASASVNHIRRKSGKCRRLGCRSSDDSKFRICVIRFRIAACRRNEVKLLEYCLLTHRCSEATAGRALKAIA
jgi:hypothetical protein